MILYASTSVRSRVELSMTSGFGTIGMQLYKDRCSSWICLFILLLLNVPVNSYCHVGTVTSDFVGLLPDFEMNDTHRPAMKHRSSKRIKLIGRAVRHTTLIS